MSLAEKAIRDRAKLIVERNRFVAYYIRHYTLDEKANFLTHDFINGADPHTLEHFFELTYKKRCALSDQILEANPPPVWDSDAHWVVVADKFNFTPEERATLLYILLVKSLFRYDFFDENNAVLAISDWSGMDGNKILELMEHQSRLFTLGLAEVPHKFSINYKSGVPDLSNIATDFLTYRIDNPLDGEVYTLQGPYYDLASFQIDPDIIATLQRILSRGNGRVLLYGEPGTGKTQLAASLAHSLQRKANFIAVETTEFDVSDLVFLAGIQGTQGPILVVDEADNLLNTHASGQNRAEGSVDKGLLNRWLETINYDVIFISNSLDYVDSSVLRRFDLVIPFETPDFERRRTFWKLIDTHNILGDGFRDRLARNYAVSPAFIRHIVDMAAEVRALGKTGLELEVYVEKITRLKGERTFHDDQRPNPHPWCLDYLHTDIDPIGIVRKLNRWLALPGSSRTGLNVLFSGPPGTGKSQFARELARLIGRPLLVKNTADLLGPFQGQTESLLSAAFEEAREGVLLLDEADTYFSDRSRASAGWVRNQVNAFLQTLENHGTICICTTNLLETADPAVFRRFTLKVSFHTLRPTDRFRIVAAYFPELDWEACRQGIEGLDDLTPGDVAVVHSRTLLDDVVEPQGILDALRAELAFRPRYEKSERRVVGFAS